jgi:hypothetical protein
MKKRLMAVLILISLALAGCGHSEPPTVVAQILSDPVYDGDIASDPPNPYTIRQDYTQSVFAGIDPGTNIEYRAFLDFPLSGIGGVPIDAVILSATLDIYIKSVIPESLNSTIPIRIDLVYFQPPTLTGSDFDRVSQPALASISIYPPISRFDAGSHVFVDVTELMIEAQRLGLPDFQIRILEELGQVSPGIIEIEDTTGPNRQFLAPLLEVTYF